MCQQDAHWCLPAADVAAFAPVAQELAVQLYRLRSRMTWCGTIVMLCKWWLLTLLVLTIGTVCLIFCKPCSKPVMTVTMISSPISGSITEPKIILASSLTRSYTTSAASLISCNPRSVFPVMLIKTPRAPSILTSSSSGELIALSAASRARPSFPCDQSPSAQVPYLS